MPTHETEMAERQAILTNCATNLWRGELEFLSTMIGVLQTNVRTLETRQRYLIGQIKKAEND